jgi:uncharacterized membrane protein
MTMTQYILIFLLWISALGSGLVAGIFFAFSTFIMTSFARIPQGHGISAMQSINSTILRSLFMPLFFGTAVASLLLAGTALFRWGEPGSMAMLAAGSIYFVGMFLCTIVFNVPLNNVLAAADPASAEAAPVWSRYLKVWTVWNHVRTVASIAACALFITAIATA